MAMDFMKLMRAVGVLALVVPGFVYILSLFESLSTPFTDKLFEFSHDITPTLLLLGVILVGLYYTFEMLKE